MRSRSPLSSSPAFLRLWVGQTASLFGFQVATIATSAIAITHLHASTHALGVLSALQTAAFLLIGLPAGAWVDGWRKRPTMIVADLIRVAVLLTVPLAEAFGTLTLTHLMIVAAVLGFATVFFDVAYQSYVPALVGPGLVADANGRLEASFQVARVGGPGLGGWLLGVLAAPFVYLFTAAAYLFSAAAILFIPDPEPAPSRAGRPGLWKRIGEGLVYVRSQPLLAPLFACIAASAFFSQGQVVLFPVLVLRDLGMSATALGILLSLGAIGGIAGAIARPWVSRRLGEGRSISVCAFLGVAATLGLPFSAGLGPCAVPLIVGASVVSSFFLTIYNVTQMSLRQRICPPELLGRLNATFRFAVWGMMPLGSLACGALAELLGVTAAFYLFIAGNLLAAALMAFTPAGRLDTRRDPARYRVD
ncbi:MAG: MFS transporter [Schaalia hyovaginalis]|uniref:MFS transporter n=1 Tax=Schaalia hyovaginalis TaxID=29316 RepID=UPI002A813C8E|nr:MFS transporter [Schaalia hyovaginalis]MDY4261786.1 MFS transporter [Schaalia hyovaginalis]